MALTDAAIAQAISAAARGSWRDLAAVLTDLATVKTTVEASTASTSNQSITAAGAVDTTKTHVELGAASAGYAITLAAPTEAQEGQWLTIHMVSNGATYAVTLALTNVIGFSAGTTATFNAVDECAIFRAVEGKWACVAQIGATAA